MNAPVETELITSGSEMNVRAEKDTKFSNATTYIIDKEDHTLGNLLRYQLLRDPEVIFSGYKCPHPLIPQVMIRVQTTDDTTPNERVEIALKSLIQEIDDLEDSVTQKINEFDE